MDMHQQLRRGLRGVILPARGKLGWPKVNAVVISWVLHPEYRDVGMRGEALGGQGRRNAPLFPEVDPRA
jgi:hypothetical protein